MKTYSESYCLHILPKIQVKFSNQASSQTEYEIDLFDYSMIYDYN